MYQEPNYLRQFGKNRHNKIKGSIKSRMVQNRLVMLGITHNLPKTKLRHDSEVACELYNLVQLK